MGERFALYVRQASAAVVRFHATKNNRNAAAFAWHATFATNADYVYLKAYNSDSFDYSLDTSTGACRL